MPQSYDPHSGVHRLKRAWTEGESVRMKRSRPKHPGIIKRVACAFIALPFIILLAPITALAVVDDLLTRGD